ncbi:MAG: Fic family protein [Acetobacteraceae bacterium]
MIVARTQAILAHKFYAQEGSRLAKQTPAEALAAIEETVRGYPDGASAQQVRRALAGPIPFRTLQYRLKSLVDRKRLVMEGEGRWARYRISRGAAAISPTRVAARPEAEVPTIPLSEAGASIREYVQRAPEARKPVGYDRKFLDDYRPNATFYLTERDRAHLAAVGRPRIAEQPAGTYARQILNRLLIDLAWNSSRLEGNTYSLLDTKRLIELGEEAEGRAHLEAQMILNHKDAIEFLVSAADEIGFNRYTILNLHALLANNLLADPTSAGRLRYIAVGIERSVFHPLEVPQLIEESFDQILATAAAIGDPFEQAFFVMVQVPYLQPFDDVNKRVSRLAANIPLIKRNLSPLSFADVPRQIYTEAVLGVYELNKVDLLKDVFIWAYERSAARYAAVRQSLGEPDPFRLRYREQFRELIADLVRARVGRKDAAAQIAAWSRKEIGRADRQRFIEIVEAELTSLHEGNFARYRIRPSEFAAWRQIWEAK